MEDQLPNDHKYAFGPGQAYGRRKKDEYPLRDGMIDDQAGSYPKEFFYAGKNFGMRSRAEHLVALDVIIRRTGRSLDVNMWVWPTGVNPQVC